LGSLTGGSLASKVVSASSITALLGGMAYQYQIGYDQGIANRLGIAVDFVPSSSDPAATPFEIVLLLLAISGVLMFLMMTLPALMIWQLPAMLGGLYLMLGIWHLLRQLHGQHNWHDLAIAGALLGFAVLVAVANRLIRWLIQRAQQRRSHESPLPPRWLRWLVQHVDSHIPDKVANLTTTLQVGFLVLLVLFSGFYGSSAFGGWLGRTGAAPAQAVISGRTTYGWLGTTSSGLAVVRPVDFCGAKSPEAARYIQITGARSTVLNPEGLQVIRLRHNLRVVRGCPKS
jgi:hypothetical protein